MRSEQDDLIAALEDGPLHPFRDWPASDLVVGPSGVYTIWRASEFLYTGMSYAHRTDLENPRAKGVFGRLASHASGRRSGDQFCVYVCDRFVVPLLRSDELMALSRGERLLDGRTRDFIHDHLGYRVVLTTSGVDARALEVRVREVGLAGRATGNQSVTGVESHRWRRARSVARH